MNTLKKTSIILIHACVKDIHGNNELETLSNLKSELKHIDNIICIDANAERDNMGVNANAERDNMGVDLASGKINIIIEDQTINLKTNCIAAAIAMYYIDKYSVKYVNPNIKNSFDLDENNKLSKFIDKYKTHRTAIKTHSIANFEYIENNNISLLKHEKRKTVKNHYADATTQILGYLFKG